MNRRDFLGIAAASIFAPRFGQWYKQGSGLIVRDVEADPAPIIHRGFEEWGYVITATTATTMTVEYLPKSRHPANPRLTSRALWADKITGRHPEPSVIHVPTTSDFRIGDVIRIPRPFGDGLMMILP